MAITLQELLVKVSADISGYTAGVDEVIGKSATLGGALDKTATSTDSLMGSLDKLGSSLTRIGAGMTAAITAPILGVSVAALKVASDLETATIAFTTMIGSVDQAKAHLEALHEFAKKTPFEFADLIQASKRLQALGFSAQQVIPTLTAIGDAAAGLGGGAQTIERISLALGQMKSKGKASADEMKQLAEAGIPAWEMLSAALTKATGKLVTTGEAMKMAEKGMINGPAAVQVLLEGIESKFKNLMGNLNTTIATQFSNLKDQVGDVLVDIGQALTPLGKKVIEFASSAMTTIQGLVTAFKGLPVALQGAILGFTALVAAAGPMLLLTGGALQAVTLLSKAFGAMGISAAGAAPALLAFATALAGLAVLGVAAKQVYDIIGSVKDLGKALDDNSTTWTGFVSAVKTNAGEWGASIATAAKVGWTAIGEWGASIATAAKAAWTSVSSLAGLGSLSDVPSIIPDSWKKGFSDLTASLGSLSDVWAKTKEMLSHPIDLVISGTPLGILHDTVKSLKEAEEYRGGHYAAMEKPVQALIQRPGVPSAADLDKPYTDGAKKLSLINAATENAKKAAEALAKAMEDLGIDPAKFGKLHEELDLVTKAFTAGKLTVDQYGTALGTMIEKELEAAKKLDKQSIIGTIDPAAVNQFKQQLSAIDGAFAKGNISLKEYRAELLALQDAFGTSTGTGGRMALRRMGIPSHEDLQEAADDAAHDAAIVLADMSRSIGEQWAIAQDAFNKSNRVAQSTDPRRTALKFLGIASIEELEHAANMAADQVAKVMASAASTIGEKFNVEQNLFAKNEAVRQSQDPLSFAMKLLNLPDLATLDNNIKVATAAVDALAKSGQGTLLASMVANRNKVAEEAKKFKATDLTSEVLTASGIPTSDTLPELKSAVEQAVLAVVTATSEGTATLVQMAALRGKELAAKIKLAVAEKPSEMARAMMGLPTMTELEGGLSEAKTKLREWISSGQSDLVETLKRQRSVFDAQLAMDRSGDDTQKILDSIGLPDLKRLQESLDQEKEKFAEVVKRGVLSLYEAGRKAKELADKQNDIDVNDPNKPLAGALRYFGFKSFEDLNTSVQEAAKQAAVIIAKGQSTLYALISAQSAFNAQDAQAQATDPVRGALAFLHIPSQEQLNEAVNSARKAYGAIADAGKEASQQGIQSWEEMTKRQIAANQELEADVIARYANIADEIKTRDQQMLEFASNISHNVQGAFDSISGMIGKNLIEWGNWGQDIKNIGKKVAEDLITTFMKQLFDPLTQQVKKAAASIATSLTESLGGFKGGIWDKLGLGSKTAAAGASEAASVAYDDMGNFISNPTAAVSNPAAAGGPGTGTGALGGSAGVFNIASLGVAVASGIVAGAQAAHANSMLDKIEESTRRMDIVMEQQPDSISSDLHKIRDYLKDFTGGGYNFGDTIHLLMELTDEKDTTKQIRDYLYNPIGPNIAAILAVLTNGGGLKVTQADALPGVGGPWSPGLAPEQIDPYHYTQEQSGGNPGNKATEDSLISFWVNEGLMLGEVLQHLVAAGYKTTEDIIAQVKTAIEVRDHAATSLNQAANTFTGTGSTMTSAANQITDAGVSLAKSSEGLATAAASLTSAGAGVPHSARIGATRGANAAPVPTVETAPAPVAVASAPTLTSEQVRVIVTQLQTSGVTDKAILAFLQDQGYQSTRKGLPLGYPDAVPAVFLKMLQDLESTKKGQLSNIALGDTNAGVVAGILQHLYTPDASAYVVATRKESDYHALDPAALAVAAKALDDLRASGQLRPLIPATNNQEYAGGLASSQAEQQAFRTLQSFLFAHQSDLNPPAIARGQAGSKGSADGQDLIRANAAFPNELQAQIDAAVAAGLSSGLLFQLLQSFGGRGGSGGGSGDVPSNPSGWGGQAAPTGDIIDQYRAMGVPEQTIQGLINTGVLAQGAQSPRFQVSKAAQPDSGFFATQSGQMGPHDLRDAAQMMIDSGVDPAMVQALLNNGVLIPGSQAQHFQISAPAQADRGFFATQSGQMGPIDLSAGDIIDQYRASGVPEQTIQELIANGVLVAGHQSPMIQFRSAQPASYYSAPYDYTAQPMDSGWTPLTYSTPSTPMVNQSNLQPSQQINISNVTFNNRADMDYLIGVVQNQL